MRRLGYLFIVIMIVASAACTSSSNNGTNGSTGDTGGGTTDGGGDGGGSGGSGTLSSAIVADHTSVAAYDSIPTTYLNSTMPSLHIYYGHTSHGSQPVTGIAMLGKSFADLEEEGSDLGHNGDLTWADTTRTRLNQPGSDINVVIWSWCGGVSDNDAAGIDAYLNAMDQLERDYPAVKFVYMTGHTDGSGASGTLRTMNKRIRDWCAANNKILYDFEDIESWDPAGTYYADMTDACDWCAAWCGAHTCGPYSISCTNDSDCAHSHCFNCYIKGKAFWWLMARLAGWVG